VLARREIVGTVRYHREEPAGPFNLREGQGYRSDLSEMAEESKGIDLRHSFRILNESNME